MQAAIHAANPSRRSIRLVSPRGGLAVVASTNKKQARSQKFINSDVPNIWWLVAQSQPVTIWAGPKLVQAGGAKKGAPVTRGFPLKNCPGKGNSWAFWAGCPGKPAGHRCPPPGVVLDRHCAQNSALAPAGGSKWPKIGSVAEQGPKPLEVANPPWPTLIAPSALATTHDNQIPPRGPTVRTRALDAAERFAFWCGDGHSSSSERKP